MIATKTERTQIHFLSDVTSLPSRRWILKSLLNVLIKIIGGSHAPPSLPILRYCGGEICFSLSLARDFPRNFNGNERQHCQSCGKKQIGTTPLKKSFLFLSSWTLWIRTGRHQLRRKLKDTSKSMGLLGLRSSLRRNWKNGGKSR